MTILIDTGILLRLLDRNDPQHALIRQAMRRLKQGGENLVTAWQNVAEFWNVCTRPSTARGGLGLGITDAERRLRILERLFPILPVLPTAYGHWRTLIVSPGAKGVQVHDARLVALMMAHAISKLFTLNVADFARYPAITAITPSTVLSATP
jgi:predicted nucleic acid-binding protein